MVSRIDPLLNTTQYVYDDAGGKPARWGGETGEGPVVWHLHNGEACNDTDPDEARAELKRLGLPDIFERITHRDIPMALVGTCEPVKRYYNYCQSWQETYGMPGLCPTMGTKP